MLDQNLIMFRIFLNKYIFVFFYVKMKQYFKPLMMEQTLKQVLTEFNGTALGYFMYYH